METSDSNDLMINENMDLDANFIQRGDPELNSEFTQVEGIEGKSACYSYGLLAMLGSGGYYFGYYMGIWNPLGQKHLRLNLNVEPDMIETYQG